LWQLYAKWRHVTLLAPRILSCFLDFYKICTLVRYTVRLGVLSIWHSASHIGPLHTLLLLNYFRQHGAPVTQIMRFISRRWLCFCQGTALNHVSCSFFPTTRIH